MTRTIGPARLGFAVALLALLLGPLALGFHSAHAQGVNVATYYGVGLDEGDTVGAWIDGTQCSETTADAAGNWLLQVGPDGDCSPSDGDTVNFSVNGEVAEQTETWSGGGGPSDSAGVTLTVAEAMPSDDNGDAMPGDDDAMPGEPDVGNAGLVQSAGGSSLLALVLGSLAVAGIAGARVATRRQS